jgi:hypothetical protein
VYVYEVAGGDLDGFLSRLVPAIRLGVGAQRDSGCGRFEVFELPEEDEESTPTPREARMAATSGLSIKLKNDLVEAATRIAGKSGGRREETSQLRNLLQISQSESEVAVLVNFIRYQAARQATQKFWNGILDDVIAVLERIGKQEAPDDPELRRLAIQHFFGYLVRAFVYAKSRAAKTSRPRPQQARGNRHDRR